MARGALGTRRTYKVACSSIRVLGHDLHLQQFFTRDPLGVPSSQSHRASEIVRGHRRRLGQLIKAHYASAPESSSRWVSEIRLGQYDFLSLKAIPALDYCLESPLEAMTLSMTAHLADDPARSSHPCRPRSG